VVAGFSQSLAMISIAVILMRTASENFRGRVMGVRMMVSFRTKVLRIEGASSDGLNT
jgi:hypothetical protein